jgi:hypothetical protein
MKPFSKPFAFSLIITALLIGGSAGEAFSQRSRPVTVRIETPAERAISDWLDAELMRAEFEEMIHQDEMREAASKAKIIAPPPRAQLKALPEQLSGNNEHWADPTCENSFKTAAAAHIDLIANLDRAKMLYTKEEWKVLAPCLVELRKKAPGKP